MRKRKKVLIVEQDLVLAVELANKLVGHSLEVRTEINHRNVGTAAGEFDADIIVIDPLFGGLYDLDLVREAIAHRGIGFVIIYAAVDERKQGPFRYMAKSLGVDVFFFGQQPALLAAIQKKLNL